MQSILDGFDTSFLHGVHYNDGELHIIVAEGFRSPQSEDLLIAGHVFNGLHSLDTSERSRLVEVGFSRPIAWQLVDESFSAFDEYELRDDTAALQILTRSRYLDFIHAHHGWFDVTRGPAKHYRIWTENEVLDVVACAPPEIKKVDRTSQPL